MEAVPGPSPEVASGSGIRPAAAGRRWPLVAWLGGALCVLGALAARPARAERNNYYRYVDEQGVVHITNVRGRPGAWKLYKSLPGSHGRGASPGRANGPRRRRHLSAERVHRYDPIIREAARRYQLPESLLRAVIHTESYYNPHAVSRAGAMGLMQLMPATARYLGVDSPFDPRQNIHGGARFLRILANHFDGDMVLVVAAYNAGAGAVKKHRGVPPYAETRAYVRAVLRRYHAYERERVLAQAERPGPARHLQP